MGGKVAAGGCVAASVVSGGALVFELAVAEYSAVEPERVAPLLGG